MAYFYEVLWMKASITDTNADTDASILFFIYLFFLEKMSNYSFQQYSLIVFIYKLLSIIEHKKELKWT